MLQLVLFRAKWLIMVKVRSPNLDRQIVKNKSAQGSTRFKTEDRESPRFKSHSPCVTLVLSISKKAEMEIGASINFKLCHLTCYFSFFIYWDHLYPPSKLTPLSFVMGGKTACIFTYQSMPLV